METINVLVLTPIGKEGLRQIANISPRIKARDGSDLVPKPPFKPGMRELFPNDELNSLLAEAEVIVGFLPPDTIARAPHLKWFQSFSAGLDNFLYPDIVKSPIIVTNVSGIHTIQISEFVFTLILALAKHLPRCIQNQDKQQWQPFNPDLLNHKTLGIVGFGNIGRGIARLGKAYGMRVVATRRSIKKVTRARFADAVYPAAQLDQLLGESDFAVLSLPSTQETTKIIGEKELRQMKPTAYLINIARGTVVDEKALIKALQENRIAGAGLDTFATEPLPTDSPLWKLPNVIVTPHIAGWTTDHIARVTEVFCENLKRYVDGKRMLNVVNKQRGY